MAKENQKLIIPISEDEAMEIMEGREFNWTFNTDRGEAIDVIIRPESDGDFMEEEEE